MFIFRLGLLTHLLANEKPLSIYNLSHFTAAKYSFQQTTLLNLIECTAYIFIFRALFSLEFVLYFLCFRSSIFKFCCLHCGEYNQSNSIAMERLMIPKSDNDVHISNPTDAMKDIKKNCYHFSIEILSQLLCKTLELKMALHSPANFIVIWFTVLLSFIVQWRIVIKFT